jgi:Putative polyhydroxyalkanoic acid system protein (PHA_gran_rgn)
VVAFPPMSELTIEVPTAKSSEELRVDLDAALKEEFPGGMLKWRWEEDAMQLWGPGAKGTIRVKDGQLVGHAELGPPASLMRPVIQQKMARVLQKVAA